MKDSKRIDNKAKSRRIAAYALAGCMAVTAAPINLPGMGAEIVEAAASTNMTQEEATHATKVTYTLNVSNLKADTTFAAIASKVKLEANITEGTTTGERFVPGKVTNVVVKKNGTAIWDSEGNYNLPGTTKIGYDNAITLDVIFESNLTLEGTPTGATVGTNKKTVTVNTTDVAAIYSSTGMLTNAASPEYRNSSGVDTSKTSIYKNEAGWWLIYQGEAALVTGVPAAGTVEKNSNGTWYIGQDKKVDFTKTGIVQAVDGNTVATGGSATTTLTGLEIAKYYVVNGKVDYNYTGIVNDSGTLYNVVKGKVSTKPTVVREEPGKWLYFDNTGTHQSNYNGFAKNDNGVWYVKNGKVDFDTTDAIDCGTINSVISELVDDTYYYVVDGKVRFDKTGLVFLEDNNGNRVLKFADKGKITTTTNITKPTLVKDEKDGTWYLVDTNGQISFAQCLVANSNGTWYCNAGKVDFDATGFIGVDTDGVYNGTPDEVYFVKNGKVQTNRTGVVLPSECSKPVGGVTRDTKYVKNGKVTGLDINESVVKAADGNWYAFDDKGDLSLTNNFAANKNGVWYIIGGKVDFKETGFINVPGNLGIKGIDNAVDAYFKDGKLQKDVTGIVALNKASVGFNAGTKYIEKGIAVAETSYKEPTAIKKADWEWYYIDENGIDITPGSKTNILVSNANGTWFIKDGKVDFNANGWFTDTDTDKTYFIKNGKIATDVSGIVSGGIVNGSVIPVKKYVVNGVVTAPKNNNNVMKASDGKWYYVDTNGEISNTFTGLAENANGVWAIKDGKVDFTVEGVLDLSNMTAVLGATGNTDSNKMDTFDSTDVLVKGGKVQFDYTGAYIDKSGRLTYFNKGKVDTDTKTGLVKASDGKTYYIENGASTTYTGLAKADDGKIWYVYKGIVTTNRTGVVSTGDIEGTSYEAGEYYVENGIMKSDKTGLVSDKADKVYVVKGQVVKDLELDESVIKIDGTWYCINSNGRVATPNSSLAGNKNGTWFIKDGKVDFTKKGIVTLAEGNVLGLNATSEVYVSGGMFQDKSTCVYAGKDHAKCYVKNGVVTTNDSDIDVRTAVLGTDGKWYGVESGTNGNAITNKVALAETKDGIALVQATGVIDFKTTMLLKLTDADDIALTRESLNEIVYIKDGKLANKVTDVVTVSKFGTGVGLTGTKKVYVKNGVCEATTGTESIVRAENGTMYYVGKTNFVAQDDTNIIGVFKGREYCVVNGKVNEKLTVDGKLLTDKDNVFGDGIDKVQKCNIVDGYIRTNTPQS